MPPNKGSPQIYAACKLPKLWLGWKDLNPRNGGPRIRCLTTWRHPNKETARKNKRLYGLSDKIRTCGLYHPKVARYQSAPHPDDVLYYSIWFFKLQELFSFFWQKIHLFFDESVKKSLQKQLSANRKRLRTSHVSKKAQGPLLPCAFHRFCMMTPLHRSSYFVRT